MTVQNDRDEARKTSWIVDEMRGDRSVPNTEEVYLEVSDVPETWKAAYEPPAKLRSGAAAPIGQKVLVLGIALVVIGILGIVFYNVVPVLTDGEETTMRSDVIDGGGGGNDLMVNTFERPLMSYLFVLVGGALLTASSWVPGPALIRNGGRLAVAVLVGFFGFLVLLDTARLFGEYFASLLTDATVSFHLHASAYLDLVMSGVVLGVAFVVGRGAVAALSPDGGSWEVGQLPLAVAGTIFAGLVLTALVPFGTMEIGFMDEVTFYFTESALDGLGAGDILTASGFLWAVAWTGLVAGLAFRLEGMVGPARLWQGIGQLMVLAGIPLLIGVVFLIIGYVDLFSNDATGPVGIEVGSVFNFVPILVYMAVIALYAVFVVRHAVPFFRSLDLVVQD